MQLNRLGILLLLLFGVIFALLTSVFGKSSELVASQLLVIPALLAVLDLVFKKENRVLRGVVYALFIFLLVMWFLSEIGTLVTPADDLYLLLASVTLLVSSIVYRRLKKKRLFTC